MFGRDEMISLQHQWKTLSHAFDRSTALRYRLSSQGWRETLAYRLDDAQHMLGLRHGIRPRGKWPVTLKHVETLGDAPVLVIWALGEDRGAIHKACDGFVALLRKQCFSPVLLTDSANFAYYARLGWLVEYLPNWEGTVASYREQKLAYLAWRYQSAVVVPISAGLASDSEWSALIEESGRR